MLAYPEDFSNHGSFCSYVSYPRYSSGGFHKSSMHLESNSAADTTYKRLSVFESDWNMLAAKGAYEAYEIYCDHHTLTKMSLRLNIKPLGLPVSTPHRYRKANQSARGNHRDSESVSLHTFTVEVLAVGPA